MLGGRDIVRIILQICIILLGRNHTAKRWVQATSSHRSESAIASATGREFLSAQQLEQMSSKCNYTTTLFSNDLVPSLISFYLLNLTS